MPAYADSYISTHDHQGDPNNEIQKEGFKVPAPKEDVVISGMSGRFPESSSVQEFEKNLYEGIDMITEDDRRWTPGLYGLPKRSGKLKKLNEFDATFFNVAPKQAHCMDPQLRMLLEVTSEAIFDAGIHPNSLKGKNIGVYVGVSVSESEQYFLEDPDKITGYELTGCCRSMFANRVSYSFDFKGPSFAIDTACSSSLVALHTAWKAINDGDIEGAIVAGTQLCLKPQVALQFNSLNMLSSDGCCKTFDSGGNGYVRSEAIAAIFLQRNDNAKRIYATVLQALVNTDGNKSKGITFPSSKVQAELVREVYQRAGVDPSTVCYLECHGTGTKAGDPQEIQAVTETFCRNRIEPLLIGSIKSNMGHAEPASGICAVIKVLLAMKNQEIPANLHFKEANPELTAILDGRLKVVDTNTPLNGQLVGINSFGFGGANAHIILKSPKHRPSFDPERFLDRYNYVIKDGEFPRLVVFSGRTEETVHDTLKKFQTTKDSNFALLMDNIIDADSSLTSYPYRGYTIVGGNINDEVFNVSETPMDRTPLWLVFSGMGSQWAGCGSRFMGIPSFAAIIQKCRGALLPLGIDVFDIVTREDPDPMLSTTASFTAIAAVQIGLVEVLRSVGLSNFDGYVGHSVGELGCGYVDGTLTAEQTVLAAYWRGRAVEEAGLPEGGMAAVGLSAEEAEKWCQEHASAVVVACHNSASSVTISGPKDEVALLKEKFDAEGIFCRDVNSGGIAFHHPSLKKAAPRLLEELQKIILQPIERSSKWKSSSFPQEKWNSGIAKHASAEYLVHNLVSPVLFAETLNQIPETARIIEVSPHALMQAVLRRALPNCTQFPLVRKESTDPLIHLLQGIGKLFISGERLNLGGLYPKQNSPVPLSTPSIASCLSWDHSIDWEVATFNHSGTKEFKVEVNLNEDEHDYLEGHNIDGRVLFPATGYMVLVWKALGKLVDMEWNSMSITFTDVVLHQATVMSSSTTVVFTVRILLKKGEFEVLAGDGVAASGKIHIGAQECPERNALQKIMKSIKASSKDFELTADEVYKELKLRGYHYKGIFQGIQKADINGTCGTLKWENNWVSLLDTMLQFSLLGSPMNGLYLPTRIRKIVIEPSKLIESVKLKNEVDTVQIRHCRNIGTTTCPGIEIHGLKATMAPRRAPSDDPILEEYSFSPNCLPINHKFSNELEDETLVRILMNLLIENSASLKVKIGHKHYGTDQIKKLSYTQLASFVSKSFKTQVAFTFAYSLTKELDKISEEDTKSLESSGIEFIKEFPSDQLMKLNLFIITNSNSITTNNISESIGSKTCILVDSVEAKKNLVNDGYMELGSIEKLNLYLLRKPANEEDSQHDIMVINESDHEFEWIEILKQRIETSNERPLWLISRKNQFTGLLGLYKCLKWETSGKKLRCLIDPNNHAPVGSKLFEKILLSDLVINIIDDGVLGTMVHLPLPELDAKSTQHSYLNVLTRGDLSSLTWLTAATPENDTNNRFLLYSVMYAPLNFRDIMLASGKLPPDALPGNLSQRECILGLEFSGVGDDGSRVMGLVAAGGLATSVRADPLLTWKVPDEWSLEEASSVPVVYATAYYALIMRGNLQRGETVLIHAGSGGVGQAAIRIALSRGCTVYTTVSTTEKKKFLKGRFPQLKEESFANSRDCTFEYHILEQTSGQGVDVVLNSLAGDLLQASVRSLKEHGRFLEIGKADLANNTTLGMSIFLKNITFHGILLDALMEGADDKKIELQNILYKGIADGEVKPLPVSSYKYDAVEDAFRFMASGKHIGKVVLDLQPAEIKKKGKKKQAKMSKIKSVFRFWPKENLVYIITGGLGGLGLEIADWLIRRGVKKIVLTSRKGVTNGYQALCIKRWKSQGVSIKISTQDSSTAKGAEKLINQSTKDGPIGGIFHLAAILLDEFFNKQTSENFKKVIKTKADGAKYLDTVSRNLCPNLHIWVTFSSIACGRGNPAQSNYAWANSVSEKIVEQRKMDGFPACAIQFSGIGDVGLFANTVGSDTEIQGTKAQSLRSVLACLDHLIGTNIPVVSSLCLANKAKSDKNSKGTKSLVSSIANILGIRDESKMPMNTSLGDLGLDSLMAVEIKQTLEREIDLIMSAEDIRNITISKIQELEKSEISSIKEDNTKLKKKFTWLDFPLNPKEISMLLNNQSNKLSPPLFIASPIQGTCELLTEVAASVNTRVIGLQYPKNIPSRSIPNLAEALIQKMEELHPSGPYYLSGYSYGASVAYEIANQMEKKGRKPISLILLDGSHTYVSGIIHSYRNKYKTSSSEESVDDVVTLGESDALVTFTLQFCSVDALQLRESLLRQSSWKERIKLTATTIWNKNKQNYPQLTIAEISSSAEMFFDRLTASFEHDPTKNTISIPTLLIRASQNNHLSDFGSDYGLSKVISGQLTVKEADGTHESIITDDSAIKVASLMNDFINQN